MPLRIRSVAGAFLFTCWVVVACGGHPGGTVGEICDDPGSARECESDEICDDVDGGGAYCLLLCNDHQDCASSERCNGVTNSSAKACHPSDDDAFDDDDCEIDDDCGGGKKPKDPF